MRKNKLITILLTVLVLVLAACGNTNANDEENDRSGSKKKEITVGVSPVYNDIANIVKEEFDKGDYTLKVQVFDDVILPNVALDEGSIDINFFQHEIYLNQYNESNGTNIEAVGDGILKFFMGVFPNEITNLDQLEDGARVSIPNDNSNRARALKTLEYNGLITLKEGVEFPTILDVVDNPKNLNLIEMDLLKQASSIQDVDISVINSVSVTQAGIDASTAIARESEEESQRYALVIAVKPGEGNEEYAELFREAAYNGALDEYLKEHFNEALYLSAE